MKHIKIHEKLAVLEGGRMSGESFLESYSYQIPLRGGRAWNAMTYEEEFVFASNELARKSTDRRWRRRDWSSWKVGRLNDWRVGWFSSW
jgi:hypothetical protein